MPKQTAEYIAGIDGCRAGWMAIVFHRGRWDYNFCKDLTGFYQTHSEVESVLIDMPIGLVEQGSEGRACDRLARRHLSPFRHSSIFTPPCRQALYGDLEQASAINFKHTGKKLSRQSINIIPKIREVDEFLLQLPPSERPRFEEAHPELIFYGLNGEQALQASKKTKEGIQDRLRLITNHFPALESLYTTVLEQTRRKDILADDIVDAMSLATAALLKQQAPQSWRQFPNPVVYDGKGLPMQLGFYLP